MKLKLCDKKILLTIVLAITLLLSIAPLVSGASSWSKPRPSSNTTYDQTIGNSYSDGIASVGMGVHIYEYIESASGEDFLHFRVSASSNTRVGIEYDWWEEDYHYYWCEVTEPTGISGDNAGTWIQLGFTLLYYGVEYQEVWVCSNGFLCLDSEHTNPSPASIPSTDEPNPIIAVFWRDLHPEQGGSITYGRDIYYNGAYYFVVSWNNVPDDSGTPQSFQVLIHHRQGWGSDDFHNYIYFQYKSITKSYTTTVGVEDQVGDEGIAYDYNNLHNGACLEFSYPIAGYRLVQLKIKLTKSDSYATIDIQETRTGGYNIILEDYTNPWGDFFKSCIKTAAGLLITGNAGIILKITLITAQLAGILSEELSPLPQDQDHIKDAGTGESEAYVRADCVIENRSIIYCKPFDSTLACKVLWWFTDPNDRDHSLTITTEAMYKDLTSDDVNVISTSTSLNMYIPDTPPGGGGGGCPYLHVWDGNQYVIDNNLLPTSQLSKGSDVEDYYTLEQDLAPRNGKYSLLVSEFESEHSYLDRLSLWAVDHESDINIAVTPDGEILTYKNPASPISCVDSYGIDQLSEIRYMDGNISDPATFFQGDSNDYLELNFGQIKSKDAKLIVRNDMLCMIKCINIQVMNNNGEWQTVAVIASRAYWAIEGVNLSPYIEESHDLMVRLVFTQPHKIDYVGLDTTKQDDYEIREANLVLAQHSEQGDVKALLLEEDNNHAELVPGQQIKLEFTLPDNPKEARTFIVYTKGHYYTIT